MDQKPANDASPAGGSDEPNMLPPIPEWKIDSPSIETREAERQKQLRLLEGLYVAVQEGTIAGISCVVVRANMVPEHAFSIGPYSAMVLLAGMEAAKHDLMTAAARVLNARKLEAERLLAKSSRLKGEQQSDGKPDGAVN